MKFEPDTLSALMDDALSAAEQAPALAQLLTDTELADRWQRYHLIGAALRDHPHDLQLLVRIQTTLAQLEPPRPAARKFPAPRLLRPVWPWVGAGGLALAASVLTALIILRPEVSRQPASHAWVQAPPPAVQPVVDTQVARNAQLDRYLVGHYAANPGTPNVLPFVTLVGYDGRGAR